MQPVADGVKRRLETIRKEYREFKHGGDVDPLALGEGIRSLANILKYGATGYEELRKEVEDMLIDVILIVQERRCAPFKARSVKQWSKSTD
ncbi:MAG: hypothetical protein ACETWE_02295 [Candidatus Bathyarchaeia archaeon]